VIADLERRKGSEPGKTRPCVIVSADTYNHELDNSVSVLPNWIFGKRQSPWSVSE
jgi:mRNA-degrading endonuclease toxin of MazEF toxin-antitoxin module